MGAVKQQSNIIKMAAREEREGIIYDSPEKFYDFEEEIGSGKMATVKKVKSKTDGKAYAAKMIYFDDDTRFAIREFDLMKSGKLAHKGLILISDQPTSDSKAETSNCSITTVPVTWPNKKAGAVVDVIGDTEFCAPEMLNFDPVLPAS